MLETSPDQATRPLEVWLLFVPRFEHSLHHNCMGLTSSWPCLRYTFLWHNSAIHSKTLGHKYALCLGMHVNQ